MTETTSVAPVARLNHAVLYVRDAQRAADFYRRVFGFEVVASEFGGQAVFMRAAGGENHHDLGLFSVGDTAPRAPRGRDGALPPGLGSAHHRGPGHRASRCWPPPARSAGRATTASPSRSTAPTRTATSSRSCGACRARRGATYEQHGVVKPLDLRAELARWGQAAAGRA